jgi:hypothetical protein
MKGLVLTDSGVFIIPGYKRENNIDEGGHTCEEVHYSLEHFYKPRTWKNKNKNLDYLEHPYQGIHGSWVFTSFSRISGTG